MGSRTAAIVVTTLACLLPSAARADTVLVFDAASPPSFVARVRAIDLGRLDADLANRGLEMPPRLEIALLANDDERGRGVAPWIVGMALEPAHIVIFHERVLAYPYDSLESVFRHEVTHLALTARAGGRPLPRWLHEGVAMSVDRGWDASARVRLLLEMTGNPGTADLTRLFASSQPGAARAYGLSAALVADVERRHGRTAPARIAGLVASGVAFPTAFEQETHQTPDEAAERAWRGYRRWTIWVSALTDDGAIWGGIVILAIVAAIVQARRRSRRRARWDADELLADATRVSAREPLHPR